MGQFCKKGKDKKTIANQTKLKHMFANCWCGEMVIDDAQEGWLKKDLKKYPCPFKFIWRLE